MDSPSILFKHECDVSFPQDILGGFENTSLRGFYFHFVVSERTMLYYFYGSNYDLVHHYNVDGERQECWRFVVRVEDISECEDRAVQLITAMLRTINICERAQPEMVRKIYFKVNSLARHVEHIRDARIPVKVDIMRVFRQAIPNPFVVLDEDLRSERRETPNPYPQRHGNGSGNGNGEGEEDQVEAVTANEHEDKPLPVARSSVAALEKVKLTPKETCMICLGGLIKATRLPCKHVFHERCIVRWLKRINACPLCRSPSPAA